MSTGYKFLDDTPILVNGEYRWKGTGQPLTIEEVRLISNLVSGDTTKTVDKETTLTKIEKTPEKIDFSNSDLSDPDVQAEIGEFAANFDNPDIVIDSIIDANANLTYEKPAVDMSGWVVPKNVPKPKNTSDYYNLGFFGHDASVPLSERHLNIFGEPIETIEVDYSNLLNKDTYATESQRSDMIDYLTTSALHLGDLAAAAETLIFDGILGDFFTVDIPGIGFKEQEERYKRNPGILSFDKSLYNFGVDILDWDKHAFEAIFGEGSYFDAPFTWGKYK